MNRADRASSPKDIRDVRREPFRMLLIRKWPSDLVNKAPSVIKAYCKYARLLQATRNNATATGPAAKRRELALGRSAHRVVEELFAFRCSLTKQTRQITNAQDSIEEGYIANMSAEEINSVLTSTFAVEFLRSPGVKEAIGSLYWILFEPPPRLVIVPLSVQIDEEDDERSETETAKNPKSPKSPGITRISRTPRTPIPSTPKTPSTPKQQVVLSPKPPATAKEKAIKWIDEQLVALNLKAPVKSEKVSFTAPTTTILQPQPKPAPAKPPAKAPEKEVIQKGLGWWEVPRDFGKADTKKQATVHNASIHDLLVRRVVEQESLDALVQQRKRPKHEEDFKICMERNPFASIQKPVSWQKKRMQTPKSPQGTKRAPAKCHYCRKQETLDPRWVFWLRPAGMPPLCQFCERHRLRGELFEDSQKRPNSATSAEIRESPASASVPWSPMEVDRPEEQNAWSPYDPWSPWRLQRTEKARVKEPKNPSKRAVPSLSIPSPKRQKPVTDSKISDSESQSRMEVDSETPVEAQPDLEAQLEAELEALETQQLGAEYKSPFDIPLPETPEMPTSKNPLDIPLPETSPKTKEPELPSPESPWDPENLELNSEPQNTEPGILKVKVPLNISPPDILLPASPPDILLPETPPDIIELEIPLCQSPKNMEPLKPAANISKMSESLSLDASLPKRRPTESRLFKPVTPPHHRIAKKKLPKPHIVQTSLANMLRMTMASFIASTRRSAAGRKNNERSTHNAAKIRRLRGQGRNLNDPRRFYDHYW